MKYRIQELRLGEWRETFWNDTEVPTYAWEGESSVARRVIAKARAEFPSSTYRLFALRRSHRNAPRKTARERAVYVINRGAMAEDIEKQIQLAVKAYAKRKANRK